MILKFDIYEFIEFILGISTRIFIEISGDVGQVNILKTTVLKCFCSKCHDPDWDSCITLNPR